jgi:cell division protein FtsQ
MRPLIARRETGPVPLPRLRPDPAPSRLTYRAQRLWLTPFFRGLLRVGLPLALVLSPVAWVVTDEAKMTAIREKVAEIRHEIEGRPEFRVNVLSIEGASPDVTEEVRTALRIELPMSSFDIDLAALRERVEALPAILSADVRINGGGYLSVTVAERAPALVWQTRTETVLIDSEGEVVAALADRELEEPLPMVAGRGAERMVEEALALFAAARPLGDRLLGLVRVGERRWDVVLRDGPRILLPEEGARAALDEVLLLHDVQQILDRDLLRIDMRNPARMTVQLTPEALETLQQVRSGEIPPLGERG